MSIYINLGSACWASSWFYPKRGGGGGGIGEEGDVDEHFNISVFTIQI